MAQSLSRIEFEKRHQELIRLYREDEASILQDVRKAGVEVLTLEDLADQPEALALSLPSLLKHFVLPHIHDVRCVIALLIGVADTSGVEESRLLINGLQGAESEELAFSIGGAVAQIAHQPHVERVIADRSVHPAGRLALVSTLAKTIGRERAIPILISLLDDSPTLTKETIKALGKLKAGEAETELESITSG